MQAIFSFFFVPPPPRLSPVLYYTTRENPLEGGTPPSALARRATRISSFPSAPPPPRKRKKGNFPQVLRRKKKWKRRNFRSRLSLHGTYFYFCYVEGGHLFSPSLIFPVSRRPFPLLHYYVSICGNKGKFFLQLKLGNGSKLDTRVMILTRKPPDGIPCKLPTGYRVAQTAKSAGSISV